MSFVFLPFQPIDEPHGTGTLMQWKDSQCIFCIQRFSYQLNWEKGRMWHCESSSGLKMLSVCLRMLGLYLCTLLEINTHFYFVISKHTNFKNTIIRANTDTFNSICYAGEQSSRDHSNGPSWPRTLLIWSSLITSAVTYSYRVVWSCWVENIFFPNIFCWFVGKSCLQANTWKTIQLIRA